MLPLRGAAVSRFREFAHNLQYRAPGVAEALGKHAPVVDQALQGVHAGTLGARAALRLVRGQLLQDPRLSRPQRTERPYAQDALREVERMLRHESQSVRADRCRLLVAHNFVRNMTSGYRTVLDTSIPGPTRRVLRLRGKSLETAIRRLCAAAGVLTPPSAKTWLEKEKSPLGDLMGDLPGYFWAGKEAEGKPIRPEDQLEVLKALYVEINGVVNAETPVVSRMLEGEIQAVGALQAAFSQRFTQLVADCQDDQPTPVLLKKCTQALSDLVLEANVALGGEYRPSSHPLALFAQQELGWTMEDQESPSGVQLTEAMTRVRVALNAYEQESIKNA